MPQLINWAIIKEPVNWAIVILMLAIATAALCLLFGEPGQQAG